LRALSQSLVRLTPAKRQRGFAGQRAVREAERAVRRHALAFCRLAAWLGLSLSEAAARLGLALRTLRRWQASWRQRCLPVRGRGRAAHRAERPLRNRALALIGLLGAGVGVPTLQALCPGLARRETADLLRRYRLVWRRRHRLLSRVLHWTQPGTVWAIDFAEPPLPIDGYGRLLAVRDLASGYQLLWLPVPDESATQAVLALEGLFRAHGSPLVLKSDNGSAFISGELATLLQGWQVWQLYSPPRMPRYNGSCEAGIGSMKTRTHHHAARNGRPGEWTCDDAEVARLEANQTARPRRLFGTTPEEAWLGRPTAPGLRAAFATTVRRRETDARLEQGFPADGPLPPLLQAAVIRTALRRSLAEHGLLEYTSYRGFPRLRRKVETDENGRTS
jgi:Integrase core domain